MSNLSLYVKQFDQINEIEIALRPIVGIFSPDQIVKNNLLKLIYGIYTYRNTVNSLGREFSDKVRNKKEFSECDTLFKEFNYRNEDKNTDIFIVKTKSERDVFIDYFNAFLNRNKSEIFNDVTGIYTDIEELKVEYEDEDKAFATKLEKPLKEYLNDPISETQLIFNVIDCILFGNTNFGQDIRYLVSERDAFLFTLPTYMSKTHVGTVYNQFDYLMKCESIAQNPLENTIALIDGLTINIPTLKLLMIEDYDKALKTDQCLMNKFDFLLRLYSNRNIRTIFTANIKTLDDFNDIFKYPDRIKNSNFNLSGGSYHREKITPSDISLYDLEPSFENDGVIEAQRAKRNLISYYSFY